MSTSVFIVKYTSEAQHLLTIITFSYLMNTLHKVFMRQLLAEYHVSYATPGRMTQHIHSDNNDSKEENRWYRERERNFSIISNDFNFKWLNRVKLYK